MTVEKLCLIVLDVLIGAVIIGARMIPAKLAPRWLVRFMSEERYWATGPRRR
jgi:hypothetical protein